MKKNILIIVAVIVVAVAAVFGAFMLLQTPLKAHDFGEFTMDVPENSHFEEGTAINSLRVLMEAMSSRGASDPSSIGSVYSTMMSDPAYTHPIWGDEEHNIIIHYINCSQDNITDHNVVGDELFSGANLDSSHDNMYFYTRDTNNNNSNSSYDITSVVCVENGHDSMVIIGGSDSQLLQRMAESIKFK